MAGDRVAYKSVPKKDEDADRPNPRKSPGGFGVRHMQTLILFVCLTVAYSMRSQLSVLMVAMVDHNAYNETDGIRGNCTDAEGCLNNYSFKGSPKTVTGWSVFRKYDWNKSTQEMITFSFFLGYTSMMLPMGILAQKYGGKRPIMVALGANGVISIITPWIPIIGGWTAVSISRLLQGMTQAAFYPSIHTMLGKWAPLSERGRLSTYVYTGSQLGTIISFQLSGLLAGSPALGWPSSFWIFGATSLVCCVLLGFFGAATPHDHPSITPEEIAYIMEDGSADITPKKRKTPWKHIITSKAVWGLISSHAGSAAGYLLILTEIPLYMSNVLGVDIKRNGVYSSLPYVSMYIMALIFGYGSDFLANRKIMTIVNIRRAANSIGMVISGIFLIAFSFVNHTSLAVVLLILSLGIHSGVHVGFHINQIDLAPNFAGPIMAVGNMIANLTGLLVPVVVSNIVRDDVKNQQKWQIVFLIFVGFQFITNTIFVIFAKGTVQPWNFYGEEENELNKITEKSISKENGKAPIRD